MVSIMCPDGKNTMGTKDVIVSIIIPVYKVAPYIGYCLRSVMHQSYQGAMECLLIDDGGEDSCMAIAENMIAEYSGDIRFKIVHHDHNRGLSAARNTGTLYATGEYIYYLDSDDEITDDCIDKMMAAALKDPAIEMVQGNACKHLMNTESVVLAKKVVLPLACNQEEVRACFYRYGQIHVYVWNKLLKRRFIIDNHILCKEGLLYEDQLWIFNLLKYVKRAAFVADITYHYKIRAQSISISTDPKTVGYHFSIVYREIMNNLTPGYEQEECDYYAGRIAYKYVRYVGKVPEYKEVLHLCQEKCKQYGSRSSRLMLAVSRIADNRCGMMIWNSLKWIRKRVKGQEYLPFLHPCGGKRPENVSNQF